MEALSFEVKSNTAFIQINRPERKNAINLSVREGLKKAWEKVNSDPHIRSVIVSGDEKFFAAGQDLEELTEFRRNEPVEDLPLNVAETFGASVRKPVITAVRGYCLGLGLLLVANSDFRIAGKNAIFGLPEVKVAVPPAMDLPVKIVHGFPKAIALEMLLFGELLDAERAFQLGFVNRVVETEKVMPVAMDFAARINKLSPYMTRLFKEQYQTITAVPRQICEFSKALAKLGRHSKDYSEGPLAFKEKREPVWGDI